MVNEDSDKKVSKKRVEFRLDLLELLDQDLIEEIMEKKQSMTQTIAEICKLARARIRNPKAETRIMIPPDCGYVLFHPIIGDICILGMKRPIREKHLKWRKLKFFDCDTCRILALKREEQVMLDRIKKPLKKLPPYRISMGTGYKVARDLVAFAMEYRTLSPSKLAEHIDRVKATKVRPQTINMWFLRHPQIRKDIEAYLKEPPPTSEQMLVADVERKLEEWEKKRQTVPTLEVKRPKKKGKQDYRV